MNRAEAEEVFRDWRYVPRIQALATWAIERDAEATRLAEQVQRVRALLSEHWDWKAGRSLHAAVIAALGADQPDWGSTAPTESDWRGWLLRPENLINPPDHTAQPAADLGPAHFDVVAASEGRPAWSHPQRFDQCDDICTVDCGHCKGAGPGLPANFNKCVNYVWPLTCLTASSSQAGRCDWCAGADR